MDSNPLGTTQLNQAQMRQNPPGTAPKMSARPETLPRLAAGPTGAASGPYKSKQPAV